MRRASRRREVIDAFREYVERIGVTPTFRELGRAAGMSSVGAWKHIQAAIADGEIARIETPRSGGRPRSKLALPELVDLSPIPTGKLRGELARRGVTLDALEEPQLLSNQGRPCAANHCANRVGRGKLFCRDHWFKLPPEFRSNIMRAWSARHVRDYQDAVEAARDRLGGFTRVVERAE